MGELLMGRGELRRHRVELRRAMTLRHSSLQAKLDLSQSSSLAPAGGCCAGVPVTEGS